MYLLRLDDASEHWNKEKWLYMHDLLRKNNVKPIIAIIPHNEDQKLLEFEEDQDFWGLMQNWIDEGWTPALHGYNHCLSSNHGGINPINKRSEFAGVDFEKQKQKIRDGYTILKEHNIHPQIFVAPAHTFDQNTLLVIKQETNIRVISDTIAKDIYFEDPFYYIPQQSGNVRILNFPLVTFCYHPNFMRKNSFDILESFLQKHKQEFTSYENIMLEKRQLQLSDKMLRWFYFAKRNIWANGK